ncbi:MAG: hypothetical protein QHC67_15525 [Sphingobium sp.]|uniref:hypothetical protein n=1 Tax=Sphingobium sp. TaxID=1912891 RepID=UPI0029A8AE65|nr:hypothetical protein [Sphingobium sp.]MDX3911208.1 hypothetical protein [Sphingobium sp.]
MTVAVIFPDGTIRQVIGALKLERDGFVQSPINCDPHWKYEWQSGHWMATARHGKIRSIPRPDRAAWWESISQMADDDAVTEHNEADAHRSAA